MKVNTDGESIMGATLKGFTQQLVPANGIRINAVTGGSGPPLLLLHGWPEPWWEWHHVMPLLAEHFALDPAPAVSESYYSLVTTAPADLAPIQRLPHFDGVEARRIAVLLFLGHGEQGGTAFYRQRATGYETVDASRLDRYRAALDTDVRTHGLPDAGYIADDTPLYERIAVQPAVFNRAIVYAGNTLHCAYLPPEVALHTDPLAGRLTLNLFLFDD